MKVSNAEPMQNNKDHLDLAITALMSKIRRYRDLPNACPDEAILASYSEGRLSSGARQKLEAHLVACEICTMMRRSLADDRLYAKDASVTYPAVIQRVKNRFTRRVDRNWLDRLFFLTRRMWWIPVITIGVLALLTAGIWGYRRQLVDMLKPVTQPAVMLSVVARKPAETLSGGRDLTSTDASESTMPNYREVELESGGMLKPGEDFQIRFELTRPAHVYFYWTDMSGQHHWFDDAEKAVRSISVKPNRTYVFPASDQWIQLKAGTGAVVLNLLAVPHPIQNPDDILRQLGVIGEPTVNTLLPNAIVKSFKLDIQ